MGLFAVRMHQDNSLGHDAWITYVSVFGIVALIIFIVCFFMIRRAFCKKCHLETRNESEPHREDGCREWGPPPPYHLALKCKKPLRMPIVAHEGGVNSNLRPHGTHNTLVYTISETIARKSSPHSCPRGGIVPEEGRSQHSLCVTERVEDYLPSYDQAIHVAGQSNGGDHSECRLISFL